MRKALSATAALAGLAAMSLASAAHAECLWRGTYWDCGHRYVYPKFYPWDTKFINGRYSMPPSPPAADLATFPPPPPGATPP